MTSWKDIFDLYVLEEAATTSKEWMTRPNINSLDGKVWATDGHAAIIVPVSLAGHNYLSKEMKTPWPAISESQKVVTIEQIEDAVAKCGTEEVMKETEVVCPECDGRGVVTWEYKADTIRGIYEKSCECPICEGEGKIREEMPTGQYGPSRHNGVKIGEAIFQAWQMARVLRTMRLLEADTLIIVSEPKKWDSTMFQIKGVPGVTILQMPMIDPDQTSTVIELMQANPATV